MVKLDDIVDFLPHVVIAPLIWAEGRGVTITICALLVQIPWMFVIGVPFLIVIGGPVMLAVIIYDTSRGL